MATIVIGDIHGNAAASSALLDCIRNEAGDGDRVVFLGDYIDRGPDSRGCIDAMLAFRDSWPGEVVCLRGNHEEWFLQTQEDYSRHSWLIAMEALDTIRSYSPEAASMLRRAKSEAGLRLYTDRIELPYQLFFDAMPATHRAFLSELSLWYECEECGCSHAGVDPAVPGLASQPPRALVWGHPLFPAAYTGETPIVYGHWNNAAPGADGWPVLTTVGNTICVDSTRHGVVSAVRMPDRTAFQSNGQQTRTLAI